MAVRCTYALVTTVILIFVETCHLCITTLPALATILPKTSEDDNVHILWNCYFSVVLTVYNVWDL